MGNCLAKPGDEGEVLVTGVEELHKQATQQQAAAATKEILAHGGSQRGAAAAADEATEAEVSPLKPRPSNSLSFLITAQHPPPKPVSVSSAMFAGGQAPRHSNHPSSHPTSPQPSPNQRSIRTMDSRLNRSTNSNSCSGVFYTLRKKEPVDEFYLIEEKLGHGQFGEVFAGTEKSTGKKFAIKSMSKSKAEADPEFLKDVRREVEIMHQLGDHPNIVRLHEVYEDAGAIHLIMELCQGGNWFQRLLDHGTYSEVQAAETIRTLLNTLAYCHSMGVVHRDIKPENILLSDDSEEATLKLADFGLSAIIPKSTSEAVAAGSKHSGSKLLSDPVGTSYYVAPEVLKARGYDHKCDVWSLGVVLYIALGGMAPFDGANEEQILESVMHGRLRFDDPTWDEVSSSAKDVIRKMLSKDPRKRASIEELLQHPFFRVKDSDKDNDLDTSRKSQTAKASMPHMVVARLQKFAAMNRFKKEARRMLATFLPEEEIMALLEDFKAMDKDGDGVLTLSELHDAMNCKGAEYLPKEQAQNLLNCVDLNANGVIDYEEFLAAAVHQMHLEKQELLFRAFQNFDHDACGFISVQELREAFIAQGAQMDAEMVLRSMGHVGLIDYPAFCSLMEKLEEQSSTKSGGISGARLLLNSISTSRESRVHSSRSRSHRAGTGHSGRSDFRSVLGSLASSRNTAASGGAASTRGPRSDTRPDPDDGAGSRSTYVLSNCSSAATHSSMFQAESPVAALQVHRPARRNFDGTPGGGGGARGGMIPENAAEEEDATHAPQQHVSVEYVPRPGSRGERVPSRMLMRDASMRDKPAAGRGGIGRRAADGGGGGFVPAPASLAHPNSTGAAAEPAGEAASAAPVRLSPLSSGYRSMLHQISIHHGAPSPKGFSLQGTALPHEHEQLSPVAGSGSSESNLAIQRNEASLDQWGLSKRLNNEVYRAMAASPVHKSRFSLPA